MLHINIGCDILKRYISLMLTLVFILCSCSASDYTSTDLLYLMLEELPDIPPCSIYFSEAETGGENYYDADSFIDLYDGMSPLELCASYALLLSKDDTVYEIHVYKSVSQIKSAEIEKLMYRRIELIQDKDLYLYDEDNYENVISRARVVKKGRYIFLLVTDQNGRLEELIDDKI